MIRSARPNIGLSDEARIGGIYKLECIRTIHEPVFKIQGHSKFNIIID